MHIFHDVFIFILPFLWGTCAGQSKESSKTTAATLPTAMAIAASQYWDGVDGEWSSFALRVGTPAQNVRAIVSTNSPATMVVLSEGCTKQAWVINGTAIAMPDNCANTRGKTFNAGASQTWAWQGQYGINDHNVGFEENLGYTQAAIYGHDTLGLGFASEGVTLKAQTIAGFVDPYPFYTGIFGLGTQPVNYSIEGNFSAPSYFTSLRTQNLIPSLSWSYTAGAKYRLKAGQVAQLVFGGYDTSRFVPNQGSFSLAPDVNRDIVVAIQSITYSGGTQQSLLPKPIYAFIESTDTNIWLPVEACRLFEKAFGLSMDPVSRHYPINDTHYAYLKAQDPQVTFTIANSISGGQTVDISLPFSAFALKVSYPFNATNATYEFPLRRADNDTQYTLGRAFLQEAYLTVDYERGNFSVSQCSWSDGATPAITTILSPDHMVGGSFSGLPENKAGNPAGAKISSGIIAIAVIVPVFVTAAIAILIYFLFRRHRRRRPVSKVPTENINLTQVDNITLATDKDHDTVSSISSPAPTYQKPRHIVSQEELREHFSPRVAELPTPAIEQKAIHQLPDHDNRASVDYFTATRAMRAARTPEIQGAAVFELAGSEPSIGGSRNSSVRRATSRRLNRSYSANLAAVEMDDEESRQRTGLSPTGSPALRSPRTPDTIRGRGSPRIPSPISSLTPWSETFFDDRSDHER